MPIHNQEQELEHQHGAGQGDYGGNDGGSQGGAVGDFEGNQYGQYLELLDSESGSSSPYPLPSEHVH